MSKKVIIIGGGIIGLCSAYYLQKEGHQVTIVDQSSMDGGASYINAGYISPSHIVPLAAPGVMKKGLKWMFDKSSPLYIKPRLDLDFLRWTWAFNKSCNQKHVEKSIPIIKDIAVWSQELYDDMKQQEQFNFHYEKNGILMLCQTDKMLEEEIEVAKIASKVGLDVSEVTLDDLKILEPNVSLNVKGGTHFRCDSHITPSEFMSELKMHLKQVGVQFYINEKVEDLEVSGESIISVITSKQKLSANEFVLSAGSWSDLLSRKLGLKLLLQAGKGYRINTTKPTGILLPAILTEAKVAVTPMNGFTRFAGTMEIAGINHIINKVRVEAISNAASRYYEGITLSQEEKENVICGLRPVSADGLPYIGKSNKCKNLTIATGHAMMGLSMGTATGKLVSEIVSDKKPTLDLNPFHPDRKF
ncbi:MAG: FAD-dependent oxidoreductase [Urechidicola sp.]|nr:FAD-dependent oxidoreductase [Urechidicola sp.]